MTPENWLCSESISPDCQLDGRLPHRKFFKARVLHAVLGPSLESAIWELARLFLESAILNSARLSLESAIWELARFFLESAILNSARLSLESAIWELARLFLESVIRNLARRSLESATWELARFFLESDIWNLESPRRASPSPVAATFCPVQFMRNVNTAFLLPAETPVNYLNSFEVAGFMGQREFAS